MTTNSLEQARSNMIEQQIRPWNVLDPRVLDLLRKVRRELFVPQGFHSLAFMDIEIPLGHGCSMWAPKIEARALQALEIKLTDHVLEVGSGSGYLTALLARIAAAVTSVEIVPELHTSAGKNLAPYHFNNLTLQLGDAAQQWDGLYDVIVLTGSVPSLPDTYLNHLKPGGRLFVIVGDAPAMTATLITKGMDGHIASDNLFEACVAPLQHALSPARFAF